MILAIDPSLTAWGYVILDGDNVVVSSSTTYKAGRTRESRLNDIYQEIDQAFTTHGDKIKTVVIEKMFIDHLSQVVGAIMAVLGKYGFAATQIAPASWKKKALGFGRLDKPQIKELFIQKYPQIFSQLEDSEHVIDAACMALAVRDAN